MDRLVVGIFCGFVLSAGIVAWASPLPFFGNERDWIQFLESRRKGIDQMIGGKAPEKDLVKTNRIFFDRLVSSGEIFIISVPGDQFDDFMERMSQRGIERYAPLDVLMGGQNVIGQIGVPRSARPVVEELKAKLAGR